MPTGGRGRKLSTVASPCDDISKQWFVDQPPGNWHDFDQILCIFEAQGDYIIGRMTSEGSLKQSWTTKLPLLRFQVTNIAFKLGGPSSSFLAVISTNSVPGHIERAGTGRRSDSARVGLHNAPSSRQSCEATVAQPPHRRRPRRRLRNISCIVRRKAAGAPRHAPPATDSPPNASC